MLEGILIRSYAIKAAQAFIYIRGEYLTEYEVLRRGHGRGARARASGRDLFGTGYDARHRPAPRRRRLHLRRGDGAAGVARTASAASRAPSRRSRPSPARSRSRRCSTTSRRTRTSRTSCAWARRTTPGSARSSRRAPGSCRSRATSSNPGNYELPFTATLGDLIEGLGGGVPDGKRLKAIIPGGSSAPFLGPDGLEGRAGDRGAGRRRHDGRLGRRDGHQRGHVHGAARPAARRSSTARVVRQVHALPRGHELDREHAGRIEQGGGRTSTRSTCCCTICDNIAGKCLCPLGDACAMPVRSMVKGCRDEFVRPRRGGRLPVRDIAAVPS